MNTIQKLRSKTSQNTADDIVKKSKNFTETKPKKGEEEKVAITFSTNLLDPSQHGTGADCYLMDRRHGLACKQPTKKEFLTRMVFLVEYLKNLLLYFRFKITGKSLRRSCPTFDNNCSFYMVVK